jgi:hypothetical protein
MKIAGSTPILHLLTFMELTGLHPSFIITDLDLKDCGYSKDKLDRALNNESKRIKDVLGGYPTVLWTGNGYHIYQPLEGFVIEEIDIFAEFVAPNEKDLTSKFMEFAEDFLTNKKGDPQHNPTVNSCLVRIPGTINSKCKEEVKVIQKWDGHRPPINYLLRDFRRGLINEKVEKQKLSSKEKVEEKGMTQAHLVIQQFRGLRNYYKSL